MSKILILALSLYSGIITASEDTDKHPECPYVLEEGEDCIDKALKIIDIEEHLKKSEKDAVKDVKDVPCLLYTSPSPRDYAASRMPSSA